MIGSLSAYWKIGIFDMKRRLYLSSTIGCQHGRSFPIFSSPCSCCSDLSFGSHDVWFLGYDVYYLFRSPTLRILKRSYVINAVSIVRKSGESSGVIISHGWCSASHCQISQSELLRRTGPSVVPQICRPQQRSGEIGITREGFIPSRSMATWTHLTDPGGEVGRVVL